MPSGVLAIFGFAEGWQKREKDLDRRDMLASGRLWIAADARE
jgi:hypothetical protein